MSRILVFVGVSVDGFIAGPNDELDFLDPRGGEEDTFTPFLAQVGALLMGRRTFDVVDAFDGPWPYGETPVLVATHRELNAGRDTVRGVRGSIEEMVARAREEAGDRDVYLDGGALIRQGLQAGLIDELTITVVPEILGAGVPLFAGLPNPREVELISQRALGAGLVELRYRPVN